MTMELTNTIDIFELIAFLSYVGAFGMTVANMVDAWRNMEASLECPVPGETAIGVSDFLVACIKVFLMAFPGAVATGLMMLVEFPFGPVLAYDPTSPVAYSISILIRMVYAAIAVGVMLESAVSFRLRWFLRQREHPNGVTAASAAPVSHADDPVPVPAPAPVPLP